MGKNTKRSKAYYINSTKKKKLADFELSTDMQGFLCTCQNRNEKICVKEAYNILNKYADVLYGKEAVHTNVSSGAHLSSAEGSDFSDTEADVEKDVGNLAKSDREIVRRFQNVRCSVNNCVFIKTILDDPLALSLEMMASIIKENKLVTRHLIRVLPVQGTCKAYIADIAATVIKLLHKQHEKIKASKSYCIVYKCRNNSGIKKEDLVSEINNTINKFCSDFIPDLVNPDIVLNIDILRKVCCIGFLPFYSKYCKYNLSRLVTDDSEDVSEICDSHKSDPLNSPSVEVDPNNDT